MYKCKICNKEFKKYQSLGFHMLSHEGKNMGRLQEKIKLSLNCLKCGKSFDIEITKNQYLKNSYKKHCSQNCANSRKIKGKKIIKCKDCNIFFEVDKRASNNLKCTGCKNKENKYCKKCGKILNRNTKTEYCSICIKKQFFYTQKLSKSLKGKTGGYRKNSGLSKGGYYKNQYFDSKFEIEVAKYFDFLNIKWIRNNKRFYFIWNEKQTYYIPDFYLINYNMYFETKGYWWSDKKEKTLKAVKINNLKWNFMMQKDWNKNKNILLEKINETYLIY